MAIGIEGQYYFAFSIGSRTDFVHQGNLNSFRIQEVANNSLPEFILDFDTDDEGILALLNEGNDIQVSYGSNVDQLTDTTLTVQEKALSRKGDNFRGVHIKGFYSALSYISDPVLFISDEKSAVEVLREVVRDHFIVGEGDFNIERSEDSQRWVQHNVTSRRFVNDLWMHADIHDSFVAVGITSDGRFLCRNVRTMIAEEPRWRIGPQIGDDPARDIVYDPDYVVGSQAGFINSWMGRGRQRVVFDVDLGLPTDLFVDSTPLISLSNSIARRGDLDRRRGEPTVLTSNMHPNFWKARMRNLINLAVFSSEKVTVAFTRQFNDIQVLDMVQLRDFVVTGEQISDVHSGVYIVGSVTRELAGGLFGTVVELYREAPNVLEGDFAAPETAFVFEE